MIVSQPQMVDHLEAAADFLGTGSIEVPIFEREIFDIVRRSSVALQRIKQVPATGHPHRYFEQTAIAQAQSVDPRNIAATASGPTRIERPAFIKAAAGQSNLSLFDKDVTEQQGQFAAVVAKDVDDIVSGIEVLRANMLWAGTDTSLAAPTTLQWTGGLTQITQQAVIAPAASIIDGLKAEVAAMVALKGYVVKPTAFYLSPVLADYIDAEAKAQHFQLDEVEVVAGVKVEALMTQAGKLPLVGDPYLSPDTTGKYGFSTPPVGNQNYYVVILMESEVEIPVISGRNWNPNPRLFQLGLVGNLAGQFVAVKFDTVIFKGPSYAHAVVAVQRP